MPLPTGHTTALRQEEISMRHDELSPEQVGRYYDEWTPRYRASFGDTFQAGRPSETADLHRYLLESADLRDGQRVLDAGCGVCGPSIAFATRRRLTIDAVTVSKEQAQTAERLVAAAGLSGRITVHLADYHTLHERFAAETFDRIVFLESLSHAADPTGPLQAAFTVLKPGGLVYIKDFFAKDHDDADEQRRVRETIARVDRTFAVKTPRLSHTVDVLRRIGFVEQRVGPVGFTNDHAVWARFNLAHDFDLFGGEEPIEWSEWLELRFQKPSRGATCSTDTSAGRRGL